MQIAPTVALNQVRRRRSPANEVARRRPDPALSKTDDRRADSRIIGRVDVGSAFGRASQSMKFRRSATLFVLVLALVESGFSRITAAQPQPSERDFLSR